MTMRDLDDALLDEPLARRLRELPLPTGDLGLTEALSHYHRSKVARRARRRTTRIATTSALAAALSASSVAAAYAASLPQPVQRVAHHLLGRLGVPAPHPGRASRAHHKEGETRAPATTITPATIAPHAAHAIRPAELAPVRVDRQQVRVGDVVHVAVAATPGTGSTRVRLVARAAGGAWRAVTPWTRHRGLDLSMRLGVNTAFAVEARVNRVVSRSRPVLVRVVPVVTAQVVTAPSRWTVTVRAEGASASDVVAIERVGVHRAVTIARAVVDRNGVARLTVPPPPRGDSYTVVVPATVRHERAAAVVTAHSRH